MSKGGVGFGISGLGLIGALIAAAIVLLLAARAWQSMAPKALEVTADPVELMETAPEDSAPSPGHLPDLNEMRTATDEHTQDVQDALDQIDGKPASDSN